MPSPRPPARGPQPSAPRIPPDVARVVEDHRALGDAARRALHVSERVARHDVQNAARIAEALRRRAQRGRGKE